METAEIRKWKRSALRALESEQQEGQEGPKLAAFSGTAALWEIALQLSVLNERERLLAPRFRELREVMREAVGTARQNQAMLRRLLMSSFFRPLSGGAASSKRTSKSSIYSRGANAKLRPV
jgi:hypothetical protein